MGEIADMMLDGTLCEGCGEYLENGADMGIPDYCSAECAIGRDATWWLESNGYKKNEKGKWVKSRNRKGKYE